ncbi:hypothetical protein H5410_056486 [Solanum commersonii]|uniref:Uncharacterized protein n=1 Tax=Solanum commersonii TaxID=4109 RepID=A0A9J5WMT7_SOLCO|nr:hypothetical protein H5410_056486 [Solanum commersonii]
MESISPDVRQDLSYGARWSRLANHSHFQGQMIPREGKPPFCRFLCAIINGSFGDPSYRRHLCRNISWTFVKTLVMKSVGPNWQIRPFSRSNDPQRRFLTSFLPKNFMDVRQGIRYGVDLSYGVSWSGWANWQFSRSKKPRIGFAMSFLSKFSWTSVKILVIESIGPDRQTDPFSRFSTSFLLKIFMDIRQDLRYGVVLSG